MGRSAAVVPARRQAPASPLPSPETGRQPDLLPTPLALRLGRERALGRGTQRAARELRDDHEPPERDDRSAADNIHVFSSRDHISIVGRAADAAPAQALRERRVRR